MGYLFLVLGGALHYTIHQIKTIKQRDGTPPEVELPFKKVPLYFRRAAINTAINTAISLFRTYVGELKTYETLKAKAEETGKIYKHSRPNPPKAINASMLYYKGMYKEFEDKSILLKLYSGKSWVWVKHHFTGRPFPENVETMSPTIPRKCLGWQSPIQVFLHEVAHLT